MIRIMTAIAVFAAASIWMQPAGAADDSLYRAMGEKDGLVRLANEFAEVLLVDPRVSDTFSESDMDRFRKQVADHFCELTGGPCVYGGLSMADAHAPFDLDEASFGAVVEDLQKAMDRVDIPFRTQNKLLAILAPMNRDIVTK